MLNKKYFNNMRGDFTLKILEFLENAAYSTASIIDLFMTDYATSYKKARGLYINEYGTESTLYNDKHRFYDMLSKLKKDGLIKKNKDDKWAITKNGILRKILLFKKRDESLPAKNYAAAKSDELKIVIFDVPEKERRKRVWLRFALKRLGFKKLQKSVWAGKVILPEEFLNDLRNLRLLSCVEILAVTKTGSLKQI